LDGSFVLGAVVTAATLKRAIEATTNRRAIFMVIRDTLWRSEPKVLAGDSNLKTDDKD
jgi:hypothetical protein